VKSLQELASALGIGVLIVHHVRKSIGETDPFEKVSGTLGLTGAADTALILDRDGNGCSLYGRGHDIQEFEKAISFSKEVCRWTIQGEASEVRRTDERSVILQVLLEQSEPMSPAEVSNATGMPRNNVKQLLFKMAKDGEVAKAPFEAWLSVEEGKAVWTTFALQDLEVEQVLDMSQARRSTQDIAAELGIGKSKVSRIQHRLKEGGRL
jgi:biotin operon repressor